MKLCLLSYDTLHLKTAQVFQQLWQRGRHKIGFMVMPFTARAKRDVLFAHRPEQFLGVGARQLAAAHGLPVHEYQSWRQQQESYDYFLVCGSNLIDAEFAETGKILNVHSGLIPSVRGLDSFKWAILRGDPMGNSLHIIDRDADAGTILAHVRTPLYSTDTLQTFADRHYAIEIGMLGSVETFMNEGEVLDLPEQDATMRMKSEVEEGLFEAFEAYKGRFSLS